MPAVPPTTRMHPSVDMSLLLVALPGIDPAIRVPGGRLWSLRLDPPNATFARVEEAVGRADASEDDVAGTERDGLAVEDALDLAVKEEVGLLERMVMDLGGATGLVVDGEDGQELGAEDAIDEHLHRDAAVREDRSVHAGGSAATGGVADAERLGLRRRPVVVADPA